MTAFKNNSSFGLIAILLTLKERDLIDASIPEELIDATLKLVAKLKETSYNSIEEGVGLFTADILKIRVDFLQWVSESGDPNLYAKLMKILDEELSHVMVEVDDPKLNKAVVSSLELITKISRGDGIQTILGDFVNDPSSIGKLSVENMKYLLAAIGVNNSQAIQNFQQLAINSIHVEFGLMLFALIANGDIKYESKHSSLARYIYDSTQFYAAYSIILGLWSPDKNDLSNEVSGARILAASIRIELGEYTEKRIDDLLTS